MEPIWIVFQVAEFDGKGSACIVAESKVHAFLKSEVEGLAFDDTDAYITDEEWLSAAECEFKDKADAGWGSNQAFTISLGSNVYHFQRVGSGTVFASFLPDNSWHLVPEQFKS